VSYYGNNLKRGLEGLRNRISSGVDFFPGQKILVETKDKKAFGVFSKVLVHVLKFLLHECI